jgi:hypothetical protein
LLARMAGHDGFKVLDDFSGRREHPCASQS